MAITNDHLEDIKKTNSLNLSVSLKDDGGERISRSFPSVNKLEGSGWSIYFSNSVLEGFYLGTRLASDGKPLPSNPFGTNLFLFDHENVIREKYVILSIKLRLFVFVRLIFQLQPLL